MPWFWIESGEMERIVEATTRRAAVSLALAEEVRENPDCAFGMLTMSLEVVPHAEPWYHHTQNQAAVAGIELACAEEQEGAADDE